LSDRRRQQLWVIVTLVLLYNAGLIFGHPQFFSGRQKNFYLVKYLQMGSLNTAVTTYLIILGEI